MNILRGIILHNEHFQILNSNNLNNINADGKQMSLEY